MSYVGEVESNSYPHLVASTLYGECNTEAATAAKVIALSDFDRLMAGVTIQIKFKYSNTATNPTLNINGTGAKPIYTDGNHAPGTTNITSWYPNSVVSMTYDGTAWRMNDVDINAGAGLMDLFNLIYPVGSVYMSAVNTSPAILFGGTWEQIKDKFLLCAGNTYTALSTGGEASVTLQTANLPSHTHEIGAHKHGLNNHTHETTHSHGLNSHTHSIPALTATTSSSGNHQHEANDYVIGAAKNWALVEDDWFVPKSQANGFASSIEYMKTLGKANDNYLSATAGAHTHTVTTSASTTGAASGQTGSTTSTTTQATGNTADSTAFNSGATGSGTAHNNMPPYLAVYCWRRVA